MAKPYNNQRGGDGNHLVTVKNGLLLFSEGTFVYMCSGQKNMHIEQQDYDTSSKPSVLKKDL